MQRLHLPSPLLNLPLSLFTAFLLLLSATLASGAPPVREPTLAGTFYSADPATLK